MAFENSAIDREKDTIKKMITLYCKSKHGLRGGLCDDCRDLLEYARMRLDRCRFGNKKPTCGQCPVHCYKPGMRERVKTVMRYAGPRMIFVHPVDGILHLIKSKRKNEHLSNPRKHNE